jgi:nitrogen fixation/metabolism regulation signal transduction histidine kinase
VKTLPLVSRLRLLFLGGMAASAFAGAGMAAWTGSPALSLAAALAVGLGAGLWLLERGARPARRALDTLRDGVRSFRDKDFSMRLAVERRDEVGDLMSLYNEVGDELRSERHALRQKEVMLETVLQATPMALLLTAADDRIVYANRAARELFSPGERLQGHVFSDVLTGCPAAMREALQARTDVLFTVEQNGEEETYHVAQREFHLNARRHTLCMVRRLTHELRRQEVEIWKKLIRLMSHELNNSLAPIASLTHSGRLIAGKPEHAHRLASIFGTIEERAGHLRDFLEGYARFARLPRPCKEPVAWESFLEKLRPLGDFRVDGPLPAMAGHFDPAQLQQVLINLLNRRRQGEERRRDRQGAVHRPQQRGDGVLRVLLGRHAQRHAGPQRDLPDPRARVEGARRSQRSRAHGAVDVAGHHPVAPGDPLSWFPPGSSGFLNGSAGFAWCGSPPNPAEPSGTRP